VHPGTDRSSAAVVECRCPVTQLDAHWSGTWATKIRGTVTLGADGWVAYLRLEDPPGLSPITTVGRFDSVEAAQVATDEEWASRPPQRPR
jgi:hypothetical protein